MSETAGKAEDVSDDACEPEGPLRLCALTRAERPIGELIRFVAAPDGAIVADLSGRLPGRGVWITCDRALVTHAVKSGAFARSLKRQVKASADLPGQIEAALSARTQSALSLANKAGLLVAGFEKVDALIGGGQAAMLIHGSDAAGGGREKLDRKLTARAREEGREAPILAPLTIEQMSLAIGRANVVHAALKHGGATEKFASEAGRLMRYRLGSQQPIDAKASPRHQV